MKQESILQFARAALITCVAALMPPAVVAQSAEVQVLTVQIDASAVKADPRLEHPVSLASRSMPLKSVLDSISKQSGVTVSIDERDPASGYPVLVECAGTPAWKVMAGLYHLFSIRRGEWSWSRFVDRGAYHYNLHETPWAKDRATTYSSIVSGMLKNYLDVLRDLYPMTMAERKLHRSELKKALMVDDDATVDNFFVEEASWLEAGLFLTALTPEQQEALLHGQSAQVSMKDLSATAIDLYKQVFHDRIFTLTYADGSTRRAPEPESIRFSAAAPSSLNSLAPLVLLNFGVATMSWMGTGNLDLGVRSAIKKAWMLPGDENDDEESAAIVQKSDETESARSERAAAAANAAAHAALVAELPEGFRPPIRPNDPISSPATVLEQMGRGTSIPILAVLPTNVPVSYPDPAGSAAKALLDRLEGRLKRHIYKWHEGVVLINYPGWFTESPSAIPYSILSDLHIGLSDRVRLTEWVSVLRKISDDQFGWLAANYGIPDRKQLEPILRLIGLRPECATARGCVVDPETFAALKSVRIVGDGIQYYSHRVRARESAVIRSDETDVIVDQFNDMKSTWDTVLKLSIPKLKAGSTIGALSHQ